MTDDLIAYLMDDLSPERRAAVDAKLESDVVWRWELQRLRECMATTNAVESSSEAPAAAADPLESSHVDLDPPLDLVQKTCCFVEDSASGKFKIENKRPRQPAKLSPAACSGGGKSWSLADVTVGVGVLLILAALIMPAIQNSRSAARSNQCIDNLRTLGAGTEVYAGINRGLLPMVRRGEPSLVYLTRLVDGGVFTPEQALAISVCPDSQSAVQRFAGNSLGRLPSTAELTRTTGAALRQMVDGARVDYAFPVGHFNDAHEVEPIPFRPSAEQPLITDAPEIGPMTIRARSHGGRTQNVLSTAGCVKSYALCVLPGEDARMRSVHLNDAGLPAAGETPDDVFLAPPDYGPDGPVALGGSSNVKVRLQFIFVPLQPQ